MPANGLYLVKVDAVAGKGCRSEAGTPARLLVICRAATALEASAAVLTPLSLAGWTQAKMIEWGPLADDPAGLDGVAGQATRHALANGYAIIAYP